jgi:hypothetical protein
MGFGIYLGARSEHAGASAGFFFVAFGQFAYVAAIAITFFH